MVYNVEEMLKEGMTPDQIAQKVLEHAKEAEAKSKENEALIHCRENLAIALTDYSFRVARMEFTDEEWDEMYEQMYAALEKEEKRISKYVAAVEKVSEKDFFKSLDSLLKGL